MRLLMYLVLGLLPFSSVAQPAATSPLNGVQLIENPKKESYSFWVSGHFYGGSNNVSGYPASTILGNVSMLNSSSEEFIMCTGDLFKDIRNNIPAYKKSLFDPLKKPLFNTVGNHDVSGDVYQENYGATYSSFSFHGDLFIILDAEADDSDIEGEQLEWFKKTIKAAQPSAAIFIFTHRPIWAEEHAKLSNAFPDNTHSLTGTNFPEDIEPILNETSVNNPIYWFSGSLGDAPAAFFYYKEEGKSIHYIQTAIRDLPKDAMLSVSVMNHKPSFKTVSLTGEELLPLEEYNLEFWGGGKPAESFNYRLVPLYLKLTFTHRYFWYGAAYTLGFMLALGWFRRRRKRREQ